MDLTPMFLQIVSDCRNSPEVILANKKDKNRILPRKGPRGDPMDGRARDIVNNIMELKTFLLQNRDQYLDVVDQTVNANGIGDGQREKIDSGHNEIITFLIEYKYNFVSIYRGQHLHTYLPTAHL